MLRLEFGLINGKLSGLIKEGQILMMFARVLEFADIFFTVLKDDCYFGSVRCMA